MVALARKVDRAEGPIAAPSVFAADVVAGLRANPKRLPPKYFYDSEGSALFEQITRLPEYYPTRCEIDILRDNAQEIAELIPRRACLIEFGSGSTVKIRILLGSAFRLAAYVPVDISAQMLEQEAGALRADFPGLDVLPIGADFTQPFELPPALTGLPHAGFFPGSTIGNFEPHEAHAFLRHAARILGPAGVLIVGVDLQKKAGILNAAYNDAAGVTGQFNLNLLARINRELGGDFDLTAFEHHAFYNSERQRIEMHLASVERQQVKVAGETIHFRCGETIHTENSYKYTRESFGALARGAGWVPVMVWTDADGYFSVQALKRQPLAR
ncbi:MAG: L-histidine N(alpha)-methyltransferase [Xanthobacteraceae bacterium]